MQDFAKLQESLNVVNYIPSSTTKDDWSKCSVQVEIKKFATIANIVPYDTLRFGYLTLKEGLMTTVGANYICAMLRGDSVTFFNNAASRIGVGTSNTAANASQTDLLGTSARKIIDVGYPKIFGETDTPTIASGAIRFRSTFGSSEGNFSWQEFGLFNAGTGGTMLDRFVQNCGTKTNGQVWELSIDFTFA